MNSNSVPLYVLLSSLKSQHLVNHVHSAGPSVRKEIFNPSRRKQLKKIIDSVEIKKDITIDGDLVLHIVLHLSNSMWKSYHLYFSELEFNLEDLKKIEYQFNSLKAFLEEEE